jgi:lysophospholipase L1-like esterase
MMRCLFSLFLALSLATPLYSAGRGEHWIAIWASAQQPLEGDTSLSAQALDGNTIRQIVRASHAGRTLRIKISNTFGDAPLVIDSIRIARSKAFGSTAIMGASDRPVYFGGRARVAIPAGADYVSDPVDLPIVALAPVAISFHVVSAPPHLTVHLASHATSYIAAGDVAAAGDLADPRPIEHWLQLAELDALAPMADATVVAFGDSITDGTGSTLDGNDRWPDQLAARLQSRTTTRHFAVVDEGIGGNRVLRDGRGPAAMARLDRDIWSLPGVRYVLLLEGVNDLGTLTQEGEVPVDQHRRFVERLTDAYAQIVAQAHMRNIRVYCGTIMPYGGFGKYHADAMDEADRVAINAWLRHPGHCDATIDFAAAMRDPDVPEHLRRDWDRGDGLHPNPAGYHAMASIALSSFGHFTSKSSVR